MMPIQKKISNYNYSSRKGNSVKYIILHYTGNKGDTAKNNVDYFYNGDRSASAHYFVDDTSIWQSVEDYNAAWAVGDGKGAYGITNQNSISIEMCCNSNGIISEKTESNTVELVKYLQKKYNISNNNVVRHYDASRKVCPNWSADNWSRWTSFKDKLNGSYQGKEEEDYNMELFSENWYLNKYKDVDEAVKKGSYKTGYHHYVTNGKTEGRQALPPIPVEYNEGAYLELNKDIKAAVEKGTYTSGLEHYLKYGYCENRKICKDDSVEAIKKRVEELELKLEEVKKIVV
ncbi:peptidoglycan recognition family protein [Clostridium sp. D53t1_180928_C8]|uniref:peptidoglycan recognition protein family protein n=1 Tax=Clostridium sp. D53t1_180928_C8 TaxID=2787101 RepID=UPI0018ABF461|nr:peptidoglycan recognition family protein [Clostridium sp. D53t1_180928_C8]